MNDETEWQIVIAGNGFVYVGKPKRVDDRIVITDCYNVRRFSLETHDGLGGLAYRSPGAESNDILDRCPTTRLLLFSIVGTYDCPDADAWQKWHEKRRKKEKR